MVQSLASSRASLAHSFCTTLHLLLHPHLPPTCPPAYALDYDRAPPPPNRSSNALSPAPYASPSSSRPSSTPPPSRPSSSSCLASRTSSTCPAPWTPPCAPHKKTTAPPSHPSLCVSLLSPLTSALLALVVFLPASVTFTRIEAVLLPADMQPIVASSSVASTSPPKAPAVRSFVAAGRSFDSAARTRMLKLYAKMLGAQIAAVAFVGLQIMVAEVWTTGGERPAASPRARRLS
ncbi:hypothetical protein MVEN_01597200 [Mycena venus]|uniref:Uncharacterized protein n=1 Tax=Mycena venus TaxID=2733690 RepID=A0A8H6XSG9_9AGAR|nr:hypothetical protein MVEN_01597200 [Mycena venus]